MKKGFTLIELLVVVLIIGILASVALPQYTLAVQKSKFANLRSIAQPFLKAMDSYYLANGSWPDDLDELSVDMPGGMNRVTQPAKHYDCFYNDKFFCCMQGNPVSGWATGMLCGLADESVIYVHLLDNIITPAVPPRRDLCLAQRDNAQAEKLCKSLTSPSYSANLTPKGATTPTGRKHNYAYYLIQ